MFGITLHDEEAFITDISKRQLTTLCSNIKLFYAKKLGTNTHKIWKFWIQ